MGIFAHKSRIIIWTLCCLITFAGSIVVARKATGWMRSRRAAYAGSYSDYDIRAKTNAEFSGPAVGTTIDLTRFKAKEGTGLKPPPNGQRIMLVALGRGCPMCRNFAREMGGVRDRVRPLGIEYYAVSFVADGTADEFFDYAHSILPDVKAFKYFDANGGAQVDRLASMAVPTHLLIDGNGTILRKWLGASNSEAIREDMADRIVSDTIRELNR